MKNTKDEIRTADKDKHRRFTRDGSGKSFKQAEREIHKLRLSRLLTTNNAERALLTNKLEDAEQYFVMNFL